MKKPTTLSPIESSQICAYLKTFEENEPVSIYPASTWDILLQCGLTQIIFRKCLNNLVKLGYGKFESRTGSVYFSLTRTGKKWIQEAER